MTASIDKLTNILCNFSTKIIPQHVYYVNSPAENFNK